LPGTQETTDIVAAAQIERKAWGAALNPVVALGYGRRRRAADVDSGRHGFQMGYLYRALW